MKNNTKFRDTFLFLSILFLCMNGVMAQVAEMPGPVKYKPERTYDSFVLGIKIMPSFSSFEMKTYSGETTKGEATHGYGYGISIEKNFSKYMGVEIDFIYNTYSKTYTDYTFKREVNINYLNIPLLFSLSTNKNIPVSFNIVCGPQFGFNAGSNSKISGNTESDSLKGILSLKQMDIDLAYGAGLNFSFSKTNRIHVGIGFRGAYGLTNIGNTSETLPKSSYYIIDGTNIKTYSGYFSLAIGF